jgi:branched-subunit amino acid ABC-type transport system permease component
MRAVADNPDLAASSGINVERVHMTAQTGHIEHN